MLSAVKRFRLWQWVVIVTVVVLMSVAGVVCYRYFTPPLFATREFSISDRSLLPLPSWRQGVMANTNQILAVDERINMAVVITLSPDEVLHTYTLPVESTRKHATWLIWPRKLRIDSEPNKLILVSTAKTTCSVNLKPGEVARLLTSYRHNLSSVTDYRKLFLEEFEEESCSRPDPPEHSLGGPEATGQ